MNWERFGNYNSISDVSSICFNWTLSNQNHRLSFGAAFKPDLNRLPSTFLLSHTTHTWVCAAILV